MTVGRVFLARCPYNFWDRVATSNREGMHGARGKLGTIEHALLTVVLTATELTPPPCLLGLCLQLVGKLLSI